MESFEQFRPVLFSIAYKMTESVQDAEDILHDVFEAFARQDAASIAVPENYLVKSVMNRSISLLEKRQQVQYPGVNLPEPLFQERYPQLQARDVSFALLVLLQKLGPGERAVFILKETLDYGYPEIAGMLSLKEEYCRQLLHRAKDRIRSDKKRFEPSDEARKALYGAYLQACTQGEVQPLINLFRNDITIYSDGGGKVSAARHPITGREACTGFLEGIYRKAGTGLAPRLMMLNGEIGIALYDHATGKAETVILFGIADDLIDAMFFVRNPDKLAGIPDLAG